MKSLLKKVCDLQQSWTNKNTPDMALRGQIIRNKIPAWFREGDNYDAFASMVEGIKGDLTIEGRDGTGQKSEIPWVRIFSKFHSPKATDGWYCTLLFHAKGEGVYLTLMHGATRFENGEIYPRPKKEIQGLVWKAKNTLAEHLDRMKNLSPSISLGSRGSLGDAYEGSTVACIWYPVSKLPSREVLFSDVMNFCLLLSILYSGEDKETPLDAIEYEVRLNTKSLAKVGGQGYRLNVAERLTIEAHAMQRAQEYLESLGYKTKDVSNCNSYDFMATKDDTEVIIVEVKGTTGQGVSILLTANEVKAHTSKYPLNALIIVHSISLDRSNLYKPIASAGQIVCKMPWKVNMVNLTPIAYQYVID